jgi:hypothetical protein
MLDIVYCCKLWIFQFQDHSFIRLLQAIRPCSDSHTAHSNPYTYQDFQNKYENKTRLKGARKRSKIIRRDQTPLTPGKKRGNKKGKQKKTDAMYNCKNPTHPFCQKNENTQGVSMCACDHPPPPCVDVHAPSNSITKMMASSATYKGSIMKVLFT